MEKKVLRGFYEGNAFFRSSIKRKLSRGLLRRENVLKVFLGKKTIYRSTMKWRPLRKRPVKEDLLKLFYGDDLLLEGLYY